MTTRTDTARLRELLAIMRADWNDPRWHEYNRACTALRNIAPTLAQRVIELEGALIRIRDGQCETCGRTATGGICPKDCERRECLWAPVDAERTARAALTAAEAVREKGE